MHPISDEDLPSTLDLISIERCGHLSDEDIADLVTRIHVNFTIKIGVFEPGLLLYRMVKVDCLPVHQARISYPPADKCRSYGRANRPGEPMFYGTLDHWFPCMFETQMENNAFYALSIWKSKSKLACGIVGYSDETMHMAATASRVVPHWAEFVDKSDRDRTIRSWQAQAFTGFANNESDLQYRISVAIRNRFMLPITNPAESICQAVDGIVYPSVASTCLYDNLALTPASVDTGLELLEVHLMTRFGSALEEPLKLHKNLTLTLKSCLQAKPTADGSLTWGIIPQFDITAGLAKEIPITTLSAFPLRSQ